MTRCSCPNGGGGRTFAEMSPGEKHRLSHRGSALCAHSWAACKADAGDWRLIEDWAKQPVASFEARDRLGQVAVSRARATISRLWSTSVVATRDRVVVERAGVPAAGHDVAARAGRSRVLRRPPFGAED